MNRPHAYSIQRKQNVNSQFVLVQGTGDRGQGTRKSAQPIRKSVVVVTDS